MQDVLSDVLDTVALKAAIYFRTDFHPPFGIAVPALGRAARFHLVVQGMCCVTLPDGRLVRLLPGDLEMVPNGSAHGLSSSMTAPTAPLEDVMTQVGFTGALRCIADTDAFPATDLILKRALDKHPTLFVDACKPWRALGILNPRSG